MSGIVEVRSVRKSYDDGTEALRGIDLTIEEGEILALLGPNGAGKTTLIQCICGISFPTSGEISVGGHHVVRDYRAARRLVGLVPQELSLEPFETVFNTIRFSRGLFGKAGDDAYLERLLKTLSLWDKRDNQIQALSGGMKRRVLIAKALSHEPRVLFLDEPTAGVDVELRKEMWETVRELQEDGVTIILTTHYIEEAEAMADRIGVISKGELLLVEEKLHLMHRMSQKELIVELQEPIDTIPDSLARYDLEIGDAYCELIYRYAATGDRTGITALLNDLQGAGLQLKDLRTHQSSLEEIFVSLVHQGEEERAA